MNGTKKRDLALALAALMLASAFSLTSCFSMSTDENGGGAGAGTSGGQQAGEPAGTGSGEQAGTSGGASGGETSDPSGRYSNFDLRADYDEDKAAVVTFSDGGAKVSGAGSGVSVEGKTVLILGEGVFILRGSCSDGRVIVEVKDREKVQLVFDGLKLASKTEAPVWIKNADKVSITLAEGTTSTLEDGGAYSDVNADGEPNACLFSKVDLTINGEGTLNVNGSVNNGITTKDDFKLISGNVNITAQNHGLRGNDSVTVRGGKLTISCKNDGIKSSKDDDPEKGYIFIEGGEISVDAGDDCLQAVTAITVSGAKLTLTPGGKEYNCDGVVSVK